MTQNTSPEQNYWKRCSSCKKEIPFGSNYQVCSVSTCHSKRKGLVFCSVECWDAHLGFANHREASAEEIRAPSKEAYLRSTTEGGSTNQRIAKKRIIVSPSSPPQSTNKKPSLSNVDTLVVVSKVKKLISDLSGFNTSQCAIDALTQRVVDECLKAIEHARSSERKTVMGRDIGVK